MKLAKLPLIIVFLISLFLLLFSAYQIITAESKINDTLEEWENKKRTGELQEDNVKIEDQTENNRIDRELEISIIDDDVFDIKEYKVAVNNEDQETIFYENRPKKGQVFGKISIPRLDRTLPIIEGTDSSELANGVGHFIGSVLPGENDNTVLAGHRDTVFRGLGEVKEDDLIKIETEAGSFTYRITGHRIVESDDRTVIVPYDSAVLTLVTCYPFHYVGDAPQRYILQGELIETK